LARSYCLNWWECSMELRIILVAPSIMSLQQKKNHHLFRLLCPTKWQSLKKKESSSSIVSHTHNLKL
jgi:hypothetical protein